MLHYTYAGPAVRVLLNFDMTSSAMQCPPERRAMAESAAHKRPVGHAADLAERSSHVRKPPACVQQFQSPLKQIPLKCPGEAGSKTRVGGKGKLPPNPKSGTHNQELDSDQHRGRLRGGAIAVVKTAGRASPKRWQSRRTAGDKSDHICKSNACFS